MKYHGKKILHRTFCLLLILLVSAQACVLSGCSDSSDELLREAKNLYAQGETEDAEYKLMLYTEDNPNDYDALILLGDWFTADGDDRATDYYAKAAKVKSYDENSLNCLNLSTRLSGSGLSFTVKPAAKYTRSMTVSVSGSAFRVDENSESGGISGGSSQLESNDMKTTQWFSVPEDEESLVAFGNMNCAVWQFADEDGSIKFYDSESSYNLSESVSFKNLAFAQTDIPSGTVRARLTYYDSSAENTLQNLDEGVYVQYGKFVAGYSAISLQTFELPDLDDGDYVEYKDGKWTLYSDGEQTVLEFDAISDNASYLQISGTLMGELSYGMSNAENEITADKSAEYGIRYKSGSTVYACQRTGDAENMNFNYQVDGEWVQNGENDFDNAYPWCGIKRCNVKVTSSGTEITYEGEDGYAEDGSNGNIMVEIPKFYVKRVVADGYEEISISGEEHDGYVLDPAFVSSSGGELEHIYVAAYLNSTDSSDEDSSILSSVSGAFPAVKLTYDDVISGCAANGEGFSEIDYVTYSALQKLFIVETGNINSSSIFSGDTAADYFFDNEDKSGYALYTAASTNTVVLPLNTYTSRLAEGDSISLFFSWDDYQNITYYQREIESLETDKTEQTVTIEFSGDKMDVIAGTTAVTNIPMKCGKTDGIDYSTGEISRGDGKSPFKYRGIENLYGAAMTMLGGAYFQNGSFVYQTADGVSHTVSADFASQSLNYTEGHQYPDKVSIKSMIYDEDNSTVMLPSVVGEGAGATSAYGDFWELDSAADDEDAKLYIAVGGANDNYELAGLFHMRVLKNINSSGSLRFTGSRMMYRPTE